MLKKSACRAAAASVLLLALSAPLRAAFQDPLVTPRSAALGNSSLAAEADSGAVFVNPAGLAKLDLVDTYFMHNQLYAGLKGVGDISEGLFSVGLPTRLGTFGLGFASFRAAGLKDERTLAVGYAHSLGERLRVGVTAKQLFHNYEAASDPLAANDPVFRQGTSKSALAFDAGLIADLAGPLQLGLTVRNLNEPDVGLVVEDRVPREFQAGLGYDFASMGLRATADVALRSGDSGGGRPAPVPSVGLEKSFEGHKVVFRVGASPQEFSGGFGLRLGRIGFDYALVLRRNLLEGNMGSHNLGLRVQFGGKEKKGSSWLDKITERPEVATPVQTAAPLQSDGPPAAPSETQVQPAAASQPPAGVQPAAPPVSPAAAPVDDPDSGSIPFTLESHP